MKLNSDDMSFLCKLSKNAGEAILKVYNTEFEVQTKSDNSPLTQADKASHQIIMEGLNLRFPKIPVLSEESAQIPFSERKHWTQYWLVDPLDGTKEFIKKNGEFTVNIAFIQNHAPVAGVVYAPVLDTLYYGQKETGSFLSKKGEPPLPLPLDIKRADNAYVIVGSRSHNSPEVNAYVEKIQNSHPNIRFTAMGSSLKICLVAEGSADLYPRLGPTMEWDTAAAHAVILGAAKTLNQHPDNTPLVYNKENLLNPWFIVK